MGARPDLSWSEAAKGLDDAAEVIELTTKLDSPIHAPDGSELGCLGAAMARPITLRLRGSAQLIRAHRHTLGLPVSWELELAGVILGRDLGHNR